MDLQHLAIIMDGNGRWAKKKGLLDETQQDTVIVIIQKTNNLGIKYIDYFWFFYRKLEKI